MEETGDLLEGAIGSGLSPDEGAELARLSRPTTYRQISRARERRDNTATLGTYEELLADAKAELGRPATGAELAARSDMSLENFLEGLADLNRVVHDELKSYGPGALKVVSRAVLELAEPEAEISRMSLLHRMSRRKVSRALELRDVTIDGWATLALLRILPVVRAELRTESVRRARKTKA
jgi:hypothetical protein